METDKSLLAAGENVVPPKSPQARRIRIDGMDLAEATGIAISRHPDISRANAVVAQGASEVAIAKSAWYPALTYSVQPGYGSFNGARKTGLDGSIGVNQLIYDFGRRRARFPPPAQRCRSAAISATIRSRRWPMTPHPCLSSSPPVRR